jgi:hypothetical protein
VIEPLLKRARNLVDEYHLAYRACFSGKAVGSDDYKHLLDLVRKARKATVAKQTREIRKLRKAIAQSPKPARKKAPQHRAERLTKRSRCRQWLVTRGADS